MKVYQRYLAKTVDDSFTVRNSEDFCLFRGIVTGIKGNTVHKLQAILSQTRDSELAALHGQFFALYYSGPNQELRIYSAPSNNYRLYYYHSDKLLLVADTIKLLVELLTDNGISSVPDELGIRMMLSYGYMLEGFSTISGIRQFGASTLLKANLQGITRQRYFRYCTNTIPRARDKAFGELKDLFGAAVKAAFERDECRKHLAFVSGGLDSRLVLFTARELGYAQVDCLNFSEPGYLDQSIAVQICKILGYGYRFFSLEEGRYLDHLDDNLIYHEAQIVLHGAAHLYQAIRFLPANEQRILHSGQIGDIMKGSYLQARGHSAVNLVAGAYSKRLLPKLASELQGLADNYPVHELFVLENRGFNCITNGDLASLVSGYSLSPFMEPQFMQYALSLDPAWRSGARFYLDWMKRCYPQAARLVWEKFNAPANYPYLLARLKYNFWRGSDKLLRKISGKPNRLNMNPFDYWWQVNTQLRERFTPLFMIPESLRDLLSQELKTDLNTMFSSEMLSERFQAYSAVRGLQYLLGLDIDRGRPE
ncbi:hypothetical protein MASR1M36_15380 [Candidatus Cloacimonadaceae bacterium]